LNANSISQLLTAFPQLFPPSTNTWVPIAPRDRAVGTFADPSLWKECTFFYKKLQAAAKYACYASRPETETDPKCPSENMLNPMNRL